MALRKQYAEAVQMRKQGASYSQIKQQLGVSKSTLSAWLKDMPLSKSRIRALRDASPIRIERYRETMRRKREERHKSVRAKVGLHIGNLSARERFIAGLFLYWGEGTKTAPTCTALANTDPAMLRFFIQWLIELGVPRSRLKVKLHIYKDMNLKQELRYWSKKLGLPLNAFRKTYIKRSNCSELSYKQRFSHGTCNIIFDNRDISEYVLAGLEHVRSPFAKKLHA